MPKHRFVNEIAIQKKIDHIVEKLTLQEQTIAKLCSMLCRELPGIEAFSPIAEVKGQTIGSTLMPKINMEVRVGQLEEVCNKLEFENDRLMDALKKVVQAAESIDGHSGLTAKWREAIQFAKKVAGINK